MRSVVTVLDIRVEYPGGGTNAEADLDPEEKEKDYPVPGTTVRNMMRPVHLAKVVKAVF
jgi:hypothetical protein